jgi:hypothetical protein
LLPTAITAFGSSGCSVNFGKSSLDESKFFRDVELDDDDCCCCCSFAFLAAELNACPYCSMPLADIVGAPI